jgi:hypothetical protein
MIANHTSGFTMEISQDIDSSLSETSMAAVLEISAPASGGLPGSTAAALVILVDFSVSMHGEREAAARRATVAAIEAISDGCLFAVVAGTDNARLVYPPEAGLAVAGPQTRAAAIGLVGELRAGGGTRMSRWLLLAHQLLSGHPDRVRHALLLTDGQNDGEQPEELNAALARCAGTFTCDARGIGEAWKSSEVVAIATTLHGDARAIGDDSELVDDFLHVVRRAMSRTVNDLRIRITTTPGTELELLRQGSPISYDLTGSGRRVAERAYEFETTAWSLGETREFMLHLAVRFDHGNRRQPLHIPVRAARIDLLRSGNAVAEPAAVMVCWNDADAPATAVHPRVERHDDQERLDRAIDEGCVALEAGRRHDAEEALGEAYRLAEKHSNEGLLRRLGALVTLTGDPGRPYKIDERHTRSALLRVAVSRTTSQILADGRADRLEPDPVAPPRTCHCGAKSPATSQFCEECGDRFVTRAGHGPS